MIARMIIAVLPYLLFGAVLYALVMHQPAPAPEPVAYTNPAVIDR